MMKRLFAAMMAAMMLLTVTACGGANKDSIHVLTRENGSGTRGAFIELMGIEEKNAAGEKVDNTTVKAEQTSSTSVMMTTVEGNAQAIGYISLGALQDNVKALKIDGVAATVDNIKNGSYKVARPFNLVTKGTLNAGAQDFLNFILSAEGQAVVEEEGYISQGNSGTFVSTNPTGKIVVQGSSSVSPVMQVLIEAYAKVNAGLKVELQQDDSSAGIKSTIAGTCDIGMASRELKDSEAAEGVTSIVMAMDGIAVIVNKSNTVDGLTAEQVKKIYVGEITSWSDVK